MTTDPKREPLPWFAFNVAEYIKDTMRLTTEGHGAYLLLILDYYATCEPCPDDDFILAAVAKLPVDIWKERHRKVLAPFFEIREGRWFHNRIEREMLEAMLKHSSSIARAQAGAHKRWGKEPLPPAPPTGKRPHRRTKGVENAPSKAQAMPEAKPEHEPKQSPAISPSNAHLHLHLKKDSLSTADGDLQGKQVEPNEGIGTTISADYRPPPELVAEFLPGVDPGTVHLEIQKFIYHHQEKGTFSLDWNASFKNRCIRFQEHHAKQPKPKAPPRVVVDVAIDAIDWDSHVAIWVKQKRWPSCDRGGEPGMLSCICPREILIKHGVDPATGDKLKEPAT